MAKLFELVIYYRCGCSKVDGIAYLRNTKKKFPKFEDDVLGKCAACGKKKKITDRFGPHRVG